MITHPPSSCARALAEIRSSAGLSREALGARASLSGATVYRLERGLVRPRRSTLTLLAHALGCDVSDLDDDRKAGLNG